MPRTVQAEENSNSVLADKRWPCSNFTINNYLMRTIWIIAIYSSLVNLVQASPNRTEADAIKNCVDGMIIPIW